jgi:hypothetical protein
VLHHLGGQRRVTAHRAGVDVSADTVREISIELAVDVRVEVPAVSEMFETSRHGHSS